MTKPRLLSTTLSLTLLCLLFTFTMAAQIHQHPFFECHVATDPNPGNPLDGGGNSTNGQVHTPDGPLRFLIVYAGFEGYLGFNENLNQTFNLNEWPNVSNNNPLNAGNNYGLPNYISHDPNTNTTTSTALFFNEESDFATFPNSTNASNILNLMSKPNRDFQFIGSVFSNPEGEPAMIVLDPVEALAACGSWTCVNQIVAEQMVDINSDPDYWTQFDQRTNAPNFGFDNSNTGPDGAIDFVVFIYRYSRNGWEEDLIDDFDGWLGSGGGFYSQLILQAPNGVIDGFDFRIPTGMCMPAGSGLPNRLFLHEFAHGLYNAPHVFGVTGVSNTFFPFGTTGLGLTPALNIFHPQMSAWERWYNGFIDPVEVTASGTFTIGDYVLTGDALKITLPFPEGEDRQYLWIENHTGATPLDNHIYNGVNVGGPSGGNNENIITNSNTGIYMYIEDMVESREEINIFWEQGNGLSMIHPEGNWDFIRDLDLERTQNNWQAQMFQYEKEEANPIGGANPWLRTRGDFDGDGEIAYNGGNVNNPGGTNEGDLIYREKINGADRHTYRAMGVSGNVGNTAFGGETEIGIGTNPTIINMPRFDAGADRIEPYFLNGLQVRINSTGPTAEIQVNYEEVEVKNDIRWTGDIVLPNITQDEEADLILDADKQITLDLSRTANRTMLNPLVDDFVNPSILTIRSGAKFHMEEASRIVVKNHSTLIIEEGAEIFLEDKACIVVEPTGTLLLRGNNITLDGHHAVIIMKGTLRTEDEVDFTFTGSGHAQFHETHQIDLGTNSRFILQRADEEPITRFLTLKENTILNIDDRELILDHGQAEYEVNTALRASGGSVTFNEVTLQGIGNTFNAIGVSGTDLTSFDIQNSQAYDLDIAFEYGDLGVVSFGSIQANVVANLIERCTTGIHIHDTHSAHMDQNELSFIYADGLKLSNIGLMSAADNKLTCWGEADGMDLTEVNTAFIDNNIVQYCLAQNPVGTPDEGVGIRASLSNIFLRSSTHIKFNTIGVLMYNNADKGAEYLLSVGKCQCAHITDNDIGVKGENIVLEIDAEENQVQCNALDLSPNSFANNAQVFDICYTDPTFPFNNTILMKGNYWGGNSLLSYNFSIRHSNCSFPVAVDDSNFETIPFPLDDCTSGGEPPISQTPIYNSTVLGQVTCEIKEGDKTYQIHKAARLAYRDFHNGDYATARSSYQPISNLDRSIHDADLCVHKINVAICMVKALDVIGVEQAQLNNESWEGQDDMESHGAKREVVYYPNPVEDWLSLEGQEKNTYLVKIYSVLGNVVITDSFTGATRLNIGNIKNGIYLLEIVDARSKEKVLSDKIVVR